MNSRTRTVYGIIALASVCALIFTVFTIQHEMHKPKLPILAQVKPFQLVNTYHEPYGLDDLKSNVWIANFIFTTCADICPVMTKNAGKLFRTFEAVPDVKMISISVNPEYDTPQRLREYGQKYGADMEKWQFLTGERDKIKELMVESFKLSHHNDPIFHSSKFVLIDRFGFVRGYYEGTDNQQLNTLFKHASILLKDRRVN